ncbi:MAG: tetratricopeptide repeat protein [Pseudomonadales bacterium]|nr:tetratricopeptide repeat protein [Pseudomonadales bacterium]
MAGVEAKAECPPLNALYPATEADWPARRADIETLLPACLQSAEYFALLGAARLNTGDVSGALEALERALLIDPNHGGAQVDYAETLYRSGQLFAALELNGALLARADLPPTLQAPLRARQAVWERDRRLFSGLVELSGGYDSNLNGAPSTSEFALTISGESALYTLDPQYQPKSGAYANARVAGSYAVISSEGRHDLLASVRVRNSAGHESDLVQADWRYGYTHDFTLPNATLLGWDITAGTSHLLFGGSPLYSVLDLRSRLMLRRESGCSPLLEAAAQYQRYHGQSVISGVESSLGGGLQCQSFTGRARLDLAGGYLMNEASDAVRPGGDRKGWRMQANWQYRLAAGALDLGASYARLNDAQGYNALLDYGARRSVSNSQFRLRYQRLLGSHARLFTSLSHLRQDSNLVPFRNKDTVLELGLQRTF